LKTSIFRLASSVALCASFLSCGGGSSVVDPTAPLVAPASSLFPPLPLAISASLPPAASLTLAVANSGDGTGSISSSPAGISCGGTCAANFAAGTVVNLIAVVPAGSGFLGWSGACTGTSATTSLVIDANVSCTANFTATQPALTVVKSGTGSGRVASSPAGIDCGRTCSGVFDLQTPITLAAIPEPGSAFTGWIGACAGTKQSSSQFLFIGNATCTAVFTSSNVPALGAHPRLWLADLQARNRLISAAQANSAEWSSLKSFCNAKTLPDFDYQGSEPYRYVANFALCYRIVKVISGEAAATPYAAKALAVLQANVYPLLNFTAYSTDSGYGIRNYVPAMAIAYDWLYDSPLLTASIKSSIVGRIKNWLDYYATTGYSNTQVIANYNAGYMVAGVLAAIAVNGEDASSAAIWTKAIALYNNARITFDRAMPGGHWPEGWNYGPGVYQAYLYAASALKITTGDLGYLSSSWLSNNVLFKLNALSPDGKLFHDDGLWSGDSIGDPRINDIAAAGFAFGWNSRNGKLARGYIDRAIAGGGSLSKLGEEWKTMLFFDPASQALDLGSLARSYHAAGTGLVTMRADWSGNAGTWGSFIAGPYLSYQGEQDKDQGHISLYRNAPLLLDVGHALYGDAGQKNTVFHNTFTLENRSDSSYSGQLTITGKCPNPLGTNAIGINAFNDGGAYAFTSGEFSAAYQGNPVYPSDCGKLPVTWLNRNILYIRPDLFIVYDQIKKAADQPQVVPTMHLHFPARPTAVAGSNRQLSIDNGAGRLQVATVFPPSSNATVNFEAANATTGPGIANWHLTVANAAGAGAMYQNFLTVLRAGQSTAAYVFPTLAAISGSNAYGTLISGLLASESPTPIVAVFADNGLLTVPVTIQYQYPSSAQTQHYVAKLKPNTAYAINPSTAGAVVTVTVTENASGTSTDDAGVLAFNL
jgi:Divergent InlB B-repeat domain